MPDQSWWRRALVLILTMREEDARRWDPQAMVDFARSFHVNALGFSTGGIVAFYPTRIPHHAPSQWLDGRDLVGETADAAHRAGLRVIGRIDPSLAPPRTFEAHPEWFARDAAGDPMLVHGYYVTCPNGGYYGRQMLQVIREILTRYPMDGLWVNAARFAPWHTGQCFCDNCRQAFAAEHGDAIPREDWSAPVWRRYNEWRYQRIAAWVRAAAEVVREARPGCAWMPLSQVGESWAFARQGGWDIDVTGPCQDVLVLECQRRYTNVWWPGLEARYLGGAAPEKPGHVTVSYFYPWWRLYRTPVPENRAWTAQVVANGARPWLHITGYLSEIFDRRGLSAFRELFRLLKQHPDAYEDTASTAQVALVYSRRTLDCYGRGDPEDRYLNHFRGYYNAMLDARIPFDVLSDARITPPRLGRYRAIVLPNVACMTEGTAAALTDYVERGGHLVTTFHTSLYDPWGDERADFLLGGAMGVAYAGKTRGGLDAAYGRIRDRNHPLVRDLGDTDVLPVSGWLCEVRAVRSDPRAPLTLVPPAGGGGISVPEFNRVAVDQGTPDADIPLVIDHRYGRGRCVYFPWQADQLAYRFGLRDLFAVLAGAVRMAPGWTPQVEVRGPGLIDVSLMGATDRLVLHLVNLSAPGSFNSGHRRPMEEIVLLTNLAVTVQLPSGARCREARSIVGRERLNTAEDGDRVSFRLRRVAEFESVVLRLE